jgi:copper chaperone CopZ
VVRALEEVEGVKHAEANFAEKQATVELEDDSVPVDRLCEALRAKGFSGKPRGD